MLCKIDCNKIKHKTNVLTLFHERFSDAGLKLPLCRSATAGMGEWDAGWCDGGGGGGGGAAYTGDGGG